MINLRKTIDDLDLSEKQELALLAALKGLDINEALNTAHDLVEAIRPLYEKNLKSIISVPVYTGPDLGISVKNFKTCPECGIKTDNLIYGVCDICRDERSEG